ncbi:unnamed protein product [Rodentolepis nana]|uniref:DZF domain-containing protein n=1 Tax=Rodentolepis nana TaxID=102285 RepID=A0A0R3TSX7_RODNA|nr:unnamed protein product [Rodentolepis nana]
MACDNTKLWRLSQEPKLKLDPSIFSSQTHNCILPSHTSQESTHAKNGDAPVDPSPVSHFAGKSFYQCSPAKRFPRTVRDQPGPSRQKQSDSDSIMYYCELCRVSCAGKISFECHLAGKRHKKMELTKQSTEEECNPKEMTCSVCDVKCSGLEAYNSHLQGKQHAKTVKLLKSRGCKIPDVKPQTSSNQLSMPSSKIDPENYIKEFHSGKTKQFSCLLCNCICTNSQLKEAHLAGKKHQTALRKLKESLETPTVKDPSDSNLEPEIPTEHTSLAQPEPSSSDSHSPSTERPQIPPTGFARPPGPRMTSSPGLPTLISLPPHLLADERYMQTKLKHILPSKEENDVILLFDYSSSIDPGVLMALTVNAVCSALQQIFGVGSSSVEDLLTSDELSGVYLVGPVAIGLQLRGQLIADVVLVIRQPLLPNYADRTRMELEGLLKIACVNHRITVVTEKGTQLIAEISPNPSSPQPSTSTAPEPLNTSSSSSDPPVARIRISFASLYVSSVPKNVVSTYQAEAEHHTSLPDGLINLRQTAWLQKALSEHPDKTALLNVARLVRCLIRDSRPVPWGEFPDYVLLVLLGHLSFMDLPLSSGYRSSALRVRPGLLFRRLLESLASGILIDRDGELSSMSDRPGSDLLLLDRMKASDRIATTSAAQEALRLVAFRQINKLLDLPRFVPPYQPKNGVKSPSTTLKTQSSLASLGKRKMNDNDDALNGRSCGEGGGCGGDTPFVDDLLISTRVIKLDEEGNHDIENDRKLV